MAIEKRIVAGQEVGFDTERKSFCNLPEEMKEPPEPVRRKKKEETEPERPE